MDMENLKLPCYFHERFDNLVEIDKILEEMPAEELNSHWQVQTAAGVREVPKQIARKTVTIMKTKNILIVTKARDNDLITITQELALWLLETPRYDRDIGVCVYVDEQLRNSRRFDADGIIQKDQRFARMLNYWTPELCWSNPDLFDLVVTLGGDGTVLYTSWLFQRIVPPVLSFAYGSLGFLTNFDYHDWTNILDEALNNGIKVNLRMRHAVQRAEQDTVNESEQYEVLNEVVIDRGPSPFISSLDLFGDDHLLTIVQADGLILSTPTGSTAYSLSAGGSLVHPEIPATLVTPICPHTLSFRPMLLPDSMVLRVSVPKESRSKSYASFDGRCRVPLRQGDYVTVRASQFPYRQVVQSRNEWIDSISRTLSWNVRDKQKAFTQTISQEEDWDIYDSGMGTSVENNSDRGESPIFVRAAGLRP
ncbi:NAD(+) kinase [Neolecta irregularis DAH-3]|uniref:NAD(+) kinase n=1 Tax=Neolecta irregularis (strain DAH-3) TaxID=1198029 RepID=A0A1U7LST9_NEOID|nr:NAD(+) kinase [Neolecta irregularis DAH-3]|eukprot:OLL25735.1 NAD(+) kinase [Neolecta irregularis DAH-3]